jgi:hypothetical protein
MCSNSVPIKIYLQIHVGKYVWLLDQNIPFTALKCKKSKQIILWQSLYLLGFSGMFQS